MGTFSWKGHILSNSRTNVFYPIKESRFCCLFCKNYTTVCWDCNVWWRFFVTNFTTNWILLWKGCCSWIVDPKSSKRWKIVSKWWLEEQIKKQKTAILIAALHKKRYFAHEYLLSRMLVGTDHLRCFVLCQSYEFELNLEVINTWEFLPGGGHGWKCLDWIFWLPNAFSSTS